MLKSVGFSIFSLCFALIVICSCNRIEKPDISNVDVNIQVKRFEKELFNMDVNSIENEIEKLRLEYGWFFKIFNQRIITIGGSHSPAYPDLIQEFTYNYSVQLAYKEVTNLYNDFEKYEKGLIKAFKYYKYYFPHKLIPEIITYIGGFNASIIVDDSLLAIGLDKYLGAEQEIYKRLNFPSYLTRNMHKNKIIPDCIYNWIQTEYAFNDSIDHVLAQMIYVGKILYATKKILPDTPDSLIIGFTQQQLDFCKMNEKKMWTYLIEYKKLFSSERMDIIKLINDAPFTNDFSNKSPGRAVHWIGWKIVEEYMKNNDVSLEQLMNNNNYMEIYNNAGYIP